MLKFKKLSTPKAEQHGIADGHVLARHGVRGRLFDQLGLGVNQITVRSCWSLFDRGIIDSVADSNSVTIGENFPIKLDRHLFEELGFFWSKKFRRYTDSDRSLLFTVNQRYESLIIARVSGWFLRNVWIVGMHSRSWLRNNRSFDWTGFAGEYVIVPIWQLASQHWGILPKTKIFHTA